jgi:hypothetical protein
VSVCATASCRRRDNLPISLPFGPIFVKHSWHTCTLHSISLHSTVHIIGCARIPVLISKNRQFLPYTSVTKFKHKCGGSTNHCRERVIWTAFLRRSETLQTKSPSPPIKSTLPTERFPYWSSICLTCLFQLIYTSVPTPQQPVCPNLVKCLSHHRQSLRT